jgi:hypothetical protein
MKLDLLTNATVADDGITFVSQKSKENLKSGSDKGDKEESNEPDYGEDQDELEEEQKEETGEITTTTNQVF